jgi:hypothetical protein
VVTTHTDGDRFPTVTEALLDLVRRPREHLIQRWNWKAALFSSLWRGGIFFAANLSSGLHAASGAMAVEAVYRAATAGFYGAVTQQISTARPAWQASAAALILLPVVAHFLEFLLHFVRGTPNLGRSIAISVAFTGVATVFNLFAMRRGVLMVGPRSRSLIDDLRALPATMLAFAAAVFHLARRAE